MLGFRFQPSDQFITQARRAGLFLILVIALLVAFRLTFIRSAGTESQSLSFALGNNLTRVYKMLFTQRASLIDERDAFRAISQTATLDLVEVQKLQNRVRELERLLSYTETVDLTYTSAKVLSRSAREGVILLDKGQRDGVEEGSAVIVEEGHLLAVVTEVRDQTSVASFTTSPQVSITGSVLERGRASGVVTGDGGYFLTMDLIPKTDTISIGEVIVTAGLDASVQSGFIIGIVEEIVEQESSAFKSAVIRPFIDYSSYSSVLIVPKP